PVQIRNCKLDGGQGKVEVAEAQIPVNGEQFIEKPITFTATNLQLAPILEALRRDTLPKVFAKLGSWTGQVVLAAKDKWIVVGQLSAIEVIFSSQSVRGKQIVNSIHTELARDHEVVTGRLNGIEMVDGIADGEAKVTLDPLLKTGAVELKFKEFLLNSSI